MESEITLSMRLENFIHWNILILTLKPSGGWVDERVFEQERAVQLGD